MQRVILTTHRLYELASDARGAPVKNYLGGQALERVENCPLAGAAFAAIPATRGLSARAAGGRPNMGALRWVLQP
jgi:hypothetical protein